MMVCASILCNGVHAVSICTGVGTVSNNYQIKKKNDNDYNFVYKQYILYIRPEGQYAMVSMHAIVQGRVIHRPVRRLARSRSRARLYAPSLHQQPYSKSGETPKPL